MAEDGGPPYDCQQCGACCVDAFGRRAYVELRPREARRLRRFGLPVLEGRGGAALATRPHDGEASVCVALDGDIGRACGCSVYVARPSVCRQFEVGGLKCRAARSEAGLPA
jgi:Fe-S-cluster containining protein